MVAERGSRESGALAEHGRDSESEPAGSQYLTGTDDGSGSEGRSATRLKSVVVPVQNHGREDGVSGSRDRSTHPALCVVILSGRNMQTTARSSSSSSSDADSDSGGHEGDTRRRLRKAGP